eukprot:TRINITY_DN75066_c0_g1_i1.p1 TRINITY_DN75066_c0_g1~~TRINITY_DN75066_c0_g1_i1.p1  ORF type:complete len:470 (+),score=175.66 TRINITY_DN75066_c0_g1_i1:84-1493(+)
MAAALAAEAVVVVDDEEHSQDEVAAAAISSAAGAADAAAAAVNAATADSDLEDDDAMGGIDFNALAEAQQLAGSGVPLDSKGKRRGGKRDKDAQKRKRQAKRADEMLKLKQAGVKVPSLREALEIAKKATESTSSSGVAAPAASSGSGGAASSSSAAVPVDEQQPDMPQQPSASAGGSASTASEMPAVPRAAGDSAKRSAVYNDLFAAVTEQLAGSSQAASSSSTSAPMSEVDKAARAKKITQQTFRRVEAAQRANKKTLFVINLPFTATEMEIRKWLEACGKITDVKMARDKGTNKPLGYAHVVFESEDAAEQAARTCDKHDMNDRVVRVRLADTQEKFEFELPIELQDDIRQLLREAYEGKNLSTIRDAWQKRHPGEKLNVCRWGFKNFSAAMRSIPGLKIEHHLEKKLTCLAFFEASPAHEAFLTLKADAEAKQGEKRAREDDAGDAGGPAKRRRTFGICGGCAVQ